MHDGRLWGRGSSDMKAGAAAIVHAATTYARKNPRAPVPLSLVLTAEEELGCLGAARVARDPSALPVVDALVIAEPTSNRPLLGHRGAVWLDLVAHGRSCHASTPHLGDNAIDKLTRGLGMVHAWADENHSGHEVLGSRTLSVGRVEGGVLRNVVPDRATAQLDFRISDAADVAGLPAALREQLSDVAEVEEVVLLSPVFFPENDRFVRQTLDIARVSIADVPDDAKAARFITDACVLTPALGSPSTVIWGPGSADLAHVVDEWCAVEEIVDASRMYDELIARRAHDGASDVAPSFAP
jgi:succinyl-diaminopimelate desuccinylase